MRKLEEDGALQKGERSGKCRCGCSFAFSIVSPGVTKSNEGDYDVECPECNTPLIVEANGTTVMRPIYLGDD